MVDRQISLRISEGTETNLRELVGTKEAPGIFRNRTHAIEAAIRFTASRVRMGRDLGAIVLQQRDKLEKRNQNERP